MKECYVPVKCSTLSSSHVLKHQERTHTAEKSFTCSACDKTFTPSNGLLCHKRTQSKKRPLSCSKFDKSITMSNVFKQDERTGTGERSFNCLACDKTFTSSNGSWPYRWFLCWRKNDNWLMVFSFWFFRAYSINEYKVSHFMTFQMVVVCGWKSAIYILVKCSTLSSTHVWIITREHTLLRSHLLAQHGTRQLHLQMVCYVIRELIVERDH